MVQDKELKKLIKQAAKEGAAEALKEMGIHNEDDSKRFRKVMYFSGRLMDATEDTAKIARRSTIKFLILVGLTLMAWGVFAIANAIKDGNIHHIGIY